MDFRKKGNRITNLDRWNTEINDDVRSVSNTVTQTVRRVDFTLYEYDNLQQLQYIICKLKIAQTSNFSNQSSRYTSDERVVGIRLLSNRISNVISNYDYRLQKVIVTK